MDFVMCDNIECKFQGCVAGLKDICPVCKTGKLRWTYSDCCNAKLIIEADKKRYCSKCHTEKP